jgi:hypothetical protein
MTAARIELSMSRWHRNAIVRASPSANILASLTVAAFSRRLSPLFVCVLTFRSLLFFDG